ncbi:MAG: CoA transferase [Chloroflexi bacterium]|nr:CoA transferase [Chloroflexota bacterium]
MPPQALEGLRILDVTQLIAGPYATKLLADYGAEVIKIERPGTGDVTRQKGPFLHDEPHPEKSGLFLHLNAGKRGVTLDLKSATGRKLFLQLAKSAEVVVESFAPGTMESFGLGYEALKAVNTRIIVTSISNFGQSGPYRDYKISEIIAYAMGGPMHETGLPEREPMKLGGSVIQFQTGAAAATATAMAVWNAEVNGHGDHLDLSLFRTQASSQDRRTTMLVGAQYTGENGDRRPPGVSTANGIRPCADGYIAIMGASNRFAGVVRMMGQPELLTDPRFDTVVKLSMPDTSEEFDIHYIPFLMQYTKRELFMMAQKNGLPSGPIFTAEDLYTEPHIRERGFWAKMRHPVVGEITQPGRPFIMNATPWRKPEPAPILGQHNAEILGGLGYSARDLSRLHSLGVI